MFIRLSLLFVFSFSFLAKAQVNNLDDLLKKVQQDLIEQRPELKERERRFIQARNSQKALLNQARAELRKEEQIMVSLQEIFDRQEKQLSQLESRLTLVMGTLGELFGVVKQTSRNLTSQFKSSIVSGQYPKRETFTQKLAQRKKLPNISELETLWRLIHQEMTETGKVTSFESEVIDPKGDKQIQQIVRVGGFNLVSQGKYLNYDSETGNVFEFPKQVSRRFLSLVDDLEEAKTGYHPFGIDPSRGALISLFMQAPTFMQRIQQGGLVGYVIILLFFLSLAFSTRKFLNLRREEDLLRQQMRSSEILSSNPLGDIQKVFEQNQNQPLEALELQLEEEVNKKTGHIQKGLGTLKVMTSIAPLLGLLGTVTGMISTFQSITLFGTGDPKLMAGGISQALVTTVLGLVAVVPLIFIYNYLSEKAKYLTSIFENETLGLLSKGVKK